MEALIVRIGDERLAGICSDLGVVLPDGLRHRHVPLIRGNTPSAMTILEKIRCNQMNSSTTCLLAQAHAIDLVCDIFLNQKGAVATREVDRVSELTAYIASDIGRDFSLSTLARMAGLNRTKLNRLFKKLHGCTVFEYIRRERLRRARQWLCQTDMPITDIAHAAGFCSSSHFCHCFHQVYGKPPRDFRSCA
jgi:AraC family transcriptional regulator